MTTRRTLNTIVLLAALALAGCDDVLLFDVAPDGRVLAAIDGRGKVVGIGDGTRPRHLAIVDPRADTVDRLTTTPLTLSWPRFCGEHVVFVEGRKTLVLLATDGTRRVLFESDRRLEQPTPSPTGDRVAVLEVDKLGLPGLLHVVDLATGGTGVPLDGALLGFAWTPRGDLLVPRLGAGVEGAAPFEGGDGEVLHLRGPQGEERRVLYSGPLAGVVWLTATPAGAVCVLPRGADKVGLALLAPDGSGATAGEQTEALDMWPAAHVDGRVLFTRSRPGRPTLEGELRLARADALGSSTRIPTPGPMCAPRWVGTDRVAYLTPDDRLVTQGLDGRGVVDWTERLRPLAGDLP